MLFGTNRYPFVALIWQKYIWAETRKEGTNRQGNGRPLGDAWGCSAVWGALFGATLYPQ
jgi:hypothetical protein